MDGKLKWASFMAQRKGTLFAVEDYILTSISDFRNGDFNLSPFINCKGLFEIGSNLENENFRKSCGTDNLLLFVDEGKVDQVIRNLLTNAVSCLF